jgi:hypothetical protein
VAGGCVPSAHRTCPAYRALFLRAVNATARATWERTENLRSASRQRQQAKKGSGTPQGGILSPLLANIALSVNSARLSTKAGRISSLFSEMSGHLEPTPVEQSSARPQGYGELVDVFTGRDSQIAGRPCGEQDFREHEGPR